MPNLRPNTAAIEKGGAMKKTKHTDGPWAHYNDKLRPQISSSAIHEIHGPTGERIITWGGFDQCDLPKPTIKANCSLIAAAPELLEALEQIVDAHFTLDYSRKNAAIRAARAAIAKAKGENTK